MKPPLPSLRPVIMLALAGFCGAHVTESVRAQDPAPAPTPATAPAPTPNRNTDRGDRANRAERTEFRGRGGFGGGLGLDEKQMELYREASELNRDALTKLDEKLRAAQKELIQATIAEKYDEATVKAKAEVVARVQTEMTMLRTKAFSTVAPSLKPEQREQLENSRGGAVMLTSGGVFGFGVPGGFGGGFAGGPTDGNVNFRGRGGAGGPGGDATGGGGGGNFRGGRGGQPGQPGGENTGDPGRGQRRTRPPGQPTGQ